MALRFSTRICTKPYNPIMDGQRLSWPCSFQLVPPPAPQMLNRWTYGAWLRGTPVGIHTTLLRLTRKPWNGKHAQYPSYCFLQQFRQRAESVIAPDVIYCVCSHLYRNVKNTLFPVSLPVCLQTWFCVQIPATACISLCSIFLNYTSNLVSPVRDK